MGIKEKLHIHKLLLENVRGKYKESLHLIT